MQCTSHLPDTRSTLHLPVGRCTCHFPRRALHVAEASDSKLSFLAVSDRFEKDDALAARSLALESQLGRYVTERREERKAWEEERDASGREKGELRAQLDSARGKQAGLMEELSASISLQARA